MSTSSIPNTVPSERPLTGSILFLLAGLAALGALATNIILPAFPQLGATLGASSQELGLTLSSFFFAFAFGQLLVGPLSDRFGRRWLVLGGLAVFVAGSVLCALADTLPFLILGRVVQALGACAASVLSRAIARDLFDGAALARALALTMIAMAAAPGFSPLLGSALDSLFGWRITFLVVAAFGVALALHYWMSAGETHPADRRVPLTSSAVASAYGRLAVDTRFLLPAVSVSLVIGGRSGGDRGDQKRLRTRSHCCCERDQIGDRTLARRSRWAWSHLHDPGAQGSGGAADSQSERSRSGRRRDRLCRKRSPVDRDALCDLQWLRLRRR
jgi:MFS transporter, DHA1 family, multidrug resistance protein